MKRFDLFALSLIAITAIYFGGKLGLSLNAQQHDVIVKELNDLSDFEARIDATHKDRVYLMASQWTWGEDLKLKEGIDYTLHIATSDIQHGFHLEKKATGTAIDVLIQPGREYLISLKGLKEGAYAIGCTEYCGIEHNKMRGKLIVRK